MLEVGVRVPVIAFKILYIFFFLFFLCAFVAEKDEEARL